MSSVWLTRLACRPTIPRMRNTWAVILLATCLAAARPAHCEGEAQPGAQADRDAIIATALDYFEGWFDGNVARMERALHPELAKRAPSADGALRVTSAKEMIDGTRAGRGKARRPADLDIKVKVDDIYGDIAAATVNSAVYVEYLHLVRTPEGWKIVNTLYVRRQPPAAAR